MRDYTSDPAVLAAEQRSAEADAHVERMIAAHGDDGHPDVEAADEAAHQAHADEWLTAQRASRT